MEHEKMEHEKVLVGEYRKSPVFTGYHTFATASHIERYMEKAIFGFHETKKDAIMAATNLFRNTINIHSFEDATNLFRNIISINPFEDGNG